MGNIQEINNLIKRGKIYADFLIENEEKYGNVFKYQIMDNIFIFTSNREAIKV